MIAKLARSIWPLLIVACFLFPVSKGHALRIKVGVLAPEGTNWAKNLKAMAKEIKTATNGKVKLKIYFGGSQGDEADVIRKTRVGQLQGGIFTGKTLGEIHGDVRVMELPFTFYDKRAFALETLNKLAPKFNQSFLKKEFKNLGFFELGLIYFVSSKKSVSLDTLKGVKIWSWHGDKLVDTMIKTMKLVSVTLSLPDVLGSLSTGKVEAAYAPPMGTIALQWNTKVKYLVDFPISYSVGAFLVTKKIWDKISPEHQKAIDTISKKYIDQINKVTVDDNRKALEVMKSQGIEFVKFPKKDVAQAQEIRKKVVDQLTGNLFSKEAYDALAKELKAHKELSKIIKL